MVIFNWKIQTAKTSKSSFCMVPIPPQTSSVFVEGLSSTHESKTGRIIQGLEMRTWNWVWFLPLTFLSQVTEHWCLFLTWKLWVNIKLMESPCWYCCWLLTVTEDLLMDKYYFLLETEITSLCLWEI